MKNKVFQDELLKLVERFWDERLPDRSALYGFFDKHFDPAIDHLIDEVARREAEIDFSRWIQIRSKGGD